jgi:hypothetical protein
LRPPSTSTNSSPRSPTRTTRRCGLYGDRRCEPHRRLHAGAALAQPFGLGPIAFARAEAERRGGHAQHRRPGAGHDLHVRGHAGQQLAFRVLDLKDHEIADHILRFGRRGPDLADARVERLVGIGIDGEPHRLADAHFADVGLVHRRFDLHDAHVGRDLEQVRGLEARRHRWRPARPAC